MSAGKIVLVNPPTVEELVERAELLRDSRPYDHPEQRSMFAAEVLAQQLERSKP